MSATDARGDGQSKEEVATAASEDRVDGTTFSGFRLYAVAIGVSFGALMMSLDVSIIGTVHPNTNEYPAQAMKNSRWQIKA